MGEKANPDSGGLIFGGSLMHSDDERKPDFSGYATKAGLKCSDGRVIMPDAFKHQDGMTVPLVWQHSHGGPENVLGHAVLENRKDGVYCYAYFNDSDAAKNAKTLVQHKDITSLSIYANQLTERAKQVLHGFIRELSLVLSGANPGALIDNITLAHSNGEMVTLDDEAIIYTGLSLAHADSKDGDDDTPEEEASETLTDTEDADDEGPTIQDIYDEMTPSQQQVLHYMVGAALEDAQHSEVVHSDTSDTSTEQEGRRMSRNVFEQENGKKEDKHHLTHDAMRGIFEDAQRIGSLKEAVESYALKHGIENIDVLFPPEKAITDTPEFLARRMEWVAGVMDGTRKTPFSRIKSLVADITFDEARAKGYIKGNMKKEEWFSVSKRTTQPTTVYKKQKLDRDDILDITDFDVVAWLKGEMRLLLDEEIARAVLIGDGRDVDDEDHIKDPVGAQDGAGIRSILNDDDLYAVTVNVNVGDAGSSNTEIVDAIITSLRFYRGSGNPTLYTTLPMLTSILLTRDTLGRRLWSTPSDLAAEMGVSNIITCEVMEEIDDLVGIIVNLSDYTIGADKGGEINFFDFFDIDYNQYKYLLETRCSGSLTKLRSALVVKTVAGSSVLVHPTEPAFDGTTITVPTVAGATYKRADTNATVTTAAPITLTSGQSLKIYAVPADSGHYFENNVEDEWVFENTN